MKCTKCSAMLEKGREQGLDVDVCPEGHGMWLDLEELDKLEDRGYEEDELKGTLIFSSTVAVDLCPHCSSALAQFQYRLYDLTIEYCPQSHGYWLDTGEEERVVDLMNQRERDMERSQKAESDWRDTLRSFRSRSFFDKLKDLIR